MTASPRRVRCARNLVATGRIKNLSKNSRAHRGRLIQEGHSPGLHKSLEPGKRPGTGFGWAKSYQSFWRAPHDRRQHWITRGATMSWSRRLVEELRRVRHISRRDCKNTRTPLIARGPIPYPNSIERAGIYLLFKLDYFSPCQNPLINMKASNLLSNKYSDLRFEHWKRLHASLRPCFRTVVASI